ncbi:MAG: endo-1,4-beta-xylanase [Lachnospiraceae bacterium]|nr:endo-1,4-beta-xylanase [Lachnospiraceae bacterium]
MALHRLSTKKMTALILAAALTAASGCGAKDTPPAAPESTVSQPAETSETPAEPQTAAAEQEAEAESTDPQESSEPEEEAASIPALRDSVEQVLGCRIGCAITGDEANDPGVWNILTTHFNAVTLGNELKPDALVAYSTSKCPGTEVDTLNGEDIIVPKLDYSRAERILNKIVKWNEEHPDRFIQVRGHVLVWHAQTPEWFFHEDYDKKKPYVTADVMDKRLEWYIRTVLTHFTGEDSKYKGLFYGWDVVNEAISDATGKPRTDAENPNESLSEDRHGSNSSWWHVYQSDQFIINAFKYANKYAPADLELYYNDYNECSIQKRNGIIALLTEIKEQEGAPGEGTRISAMGMQGHYGIDSPGSTDVAASIKAYGKVVGSVQITEWDMSASSSYDGTEETLQEEYEKQRKIYNLEYYALKAAQNSGDANVTGITFWGTIDPYSWLQSRSNLGGGNKTGLAQCPLLFDGNYEPKPAFWVFAATN